MTTTTEVVFEPRAKAPSLDASKLEVLGRVGGRGPQFGRLGDREFVLHGELAPYTVDDAPRPGVVLLGRTVTERGPDGRGTRRRWQVIEAREVEAGTFIALKAKHERREARLASERERSTTPRYVDLLSSLTALQGRQPNIIPLGPNLPAAEALGGVGIGSEARVDLGLPKRKASELVIREEAPRRGMEGAWEYLTAHRGIRFGLSASGRLALPASHITYQDREVVEALGEDVIVGLLNAKGFPRCELDHGKGEAPVAFTLAWPNRLPVCEAHLLGTAA